MAVNEAPFTGGAWLNRKAYDAAIVWLEQRTFDRQISLTRDEVADFEWNGQPFRLIPSQQGIWKP